MKFKELVNGDIFIHKDKLYVKCYNFAQKLNKDNPSNRQSSQSTNFVLFAKDTVISKLKNYERFKFKQLDLVKILKINNPDKSNSIMRASVGKIGLVEDSIGTKAKVLNSWWEFNELEMVTRNEELIEPPNHLYTVAKEVAVTKPSYLIGKIQ